MHEHHKKTLKLVLFKKKNYWFNSEATEALSAEAVAGLSPVAQRLLAEEEVANAKERDDVLWKVARGLGANRRCSWRKHPN